MYDRRPPRRRTGRTRSRTRGREALARLALLALLVGIAGLAPGAGVAAADGAPAAGIDRSPSGGPDGDAEAADGLDDALSLATSGVTLDYLKAALLVGVLFGGFLGRFASAVRLAADVKSRAFRSVASVAPDRLRRRSQTKTAGEDVEEGSRSDEEVVRELLEERGGRMRQSDIVEETEWSKAKVSRLLGEMEDDGEIVKVPIGRQNLVYLDGAEPEITRPTRGSR